MGQLSLELFERVAVAVTLLCAVSALFTVPSPRDIAGDERLDCDCEPMRKGSGAVTATLSGAAASGTGIRLAGAKLHGVRGALAAIGLRSGDVVSTINGIPVAAPSNSMELLSSVRSADHIQVGIVRDGRPITFDYFIH
jgi:hypothetical protein